MFLNEEILVEQTIIEFLFFGMVESRRNPQLNIKTSLIDELQAYKNDPYAFITFTNIEKFGVYPNTKGNESPLGLYAYPLKQVWKNIEINSIPYGKERKYCILFTTGHPLLKDVSEYGTYELQRDLTTLKGFYKNFVIQKTGKDFSSFITEYLIKDYHPFKKMWDITQQIAKLYDSASYEGKWNTILRKLQYIGYTDKTGLGLIHAAEPVQAVFLSPTLLNIHIIKSIPNKRYSTHTSTISHIYQIIKNSKTDDIKIHFAVIENLAKNDPEVIENLSTGDMIKLLDISSIVVNSTIAKNNPYRLYTQLKTKTFEFKGRLAGDIFSKILNGLIFYIKNDIEYTQNFLYKYIEDHPGDPLKQALKANGYFFDNKFTEDELKEILDGKL